MSHDRTQPRGDAASTDELRADELGAALAHIGHLLPDQAPIRVFIHHNTLHAFQHLPFHDAVRAARDVYGAEPYFSERRFRALFEQGRIDAQDLEYALRDQLPEDETTLIPGLLPAHGVRRLMLEHAIESETDATLRWQIEERGINEQLRADIPDAARARALDESTRFFRELLAQGDEASVLRFGALVTGACEPQVTRAEFARRFAHELDAESARRVLASRGEACVASALFHTTRALSASYRAPASAPCSLTLHRDVLLEALHEDIYDRVFPELIRLASAYLDDGVASWSMPGRERGFYRAVRELVAHEGPVPMRWLERVKRDFRAQLERDATPTDVALEVLAELGVGAHELEAYLQKLLLTLPGWAGMMHRLERHHDLPPSSPQASLLEFLAVRLTYERAALCDLRARAGLDTRALASLRERREAAHARAPESAASAGYRLFQLLQLAGASLPEAQALDETGALQILQTMDAFDELWRRRVLQEAYEHHYRVQQLDAIAAHRDASAFAAPLVRPPLQIICCFDDREECLRRHLEEVNPAVRTFGAPGFFGAAIRFRGIDEHQHVPLAPVVIQPTHHIDEQPHASDAHLLAARTRRRRRWASLSRALSAGSRSLWRGALVNVALGMLALVPLLMRVASPRLAGRVRKWAATRVLPSPRTELTVHHDEAGDPGIARGFKVDERVARVATVLENIGLTKTFARVIVLLGHGATTLNNPHKSAYDCGACGGRQGGPNARVFARMANDPEVRARLAERGIPIPEDTVFLGGQHDTCSDEITLFDLAHLPATHAAELAEVQKTLDEARARTAQERCRRLFSAPREASPKEALAHVEGRAEHLAEPRPEFGHATNAIAIIGRRALTRGLFLDRRAFVLSYDPTIDEDGAILERTLAAATPVGAGINLEYYFSCVDNERYGAGSKLPHNVSGLIGVMSGHASDLRTGLPRQMIEIHEPLRLLILVEATPERLLQIAAKQAEVREFVVNRWVQLVSVDPVTGAMQLFTQRGFEPYLPRPVRLPEANSSRDFYRGHADFLPPARILERAVRAA